MDELPIVSGDDVVRVRQHVRAAAADTGLSLVDQTKLVTAASELARNALVHAGGGTARVEVAESVTGRAGIELVTVDAGPGVRDVGAALRDGHSTGGTLGIGLGSISRQADFCDIYSAAGHGTALVARFWPDPAARRPSAGPA